MISLSHASSSETANTKLMLQRFENRTAATATRFWVGEVTDIVGTCRQLNLDGMTQRFKGPGPVAYQRFKGWQLRINDSYQSFFF
jgi:hypothetical protein